MMVDRERRIHLRLGLVGDRTDLYHTSARFRSVVRTLEELAPILMDVLAEKSEEELVAMARMRESLARKYEKPGPL